MNQERRKILDKIINQLEDIQAQIESVKSDEEDALENIPEQLRDNDAGTKIQESMDALDEAVNYVGSVIDYINEAM